jgi:hypothetical protein
MRCRSDDFVSLVRACGLDPAHDFRNADLSGTDLRCADLTEFDFRNARFTGALVEGTSFNGTVSQEQLLDAVHSGDGRPVVRPPTILVVPLGARADQISRQVHAPDWRPSFESDSSGPWEYVVSTGAHLPPPGADVPPIIQVARAGDDLHADAFDVVVVIGDDEVGVEVTGPQNSLKLPSLSAPGIRLFVPALPKDHPSDILVGSMPTRGPFHAIVDSSVVRSPFWSGNTWRALDRRIADVAIGAAMLVGGSKGVSKVLSDVSELMPTPVLSFAFGPHFREDGTPHAEFLPGLSSEAVGIAGAPGNLAVIRSMPFKPIWARQRPKQSERGIVEVRTPEAGDTVAFLKEVARHASPGVQLSVPEVPPDLVRHLKYPGLAIGLSANSASGGAPVAVLAETPGLGLVQSAAFLGWKVARYTDGDFIREALTGEGLGGRNQLPNELLLPVLKQRSENKGLATRGVDPRDVVVVAPDVFMDTGELPAALEDQLRSFRAAFQVEDAAVPDHLIPTASLDDWLASEPQIGTVLRDFIGDARKRKQRVQKRPADLRVAWSRPVPPLLRFIVADGPIPVRLDLLAPETAPAQSLFIVDGDEAVPALLHSPLFETWARATTTRSTSWMSRFSVSRTFETFPIVPPFAMAGGRGLVVMRPAPSLSRLAGAWLEEVRRGVRTARDPLEHQAHEAARIRVELDALVLAAYGLEADASDVVIMNRLIAMAAETAG